MKEQAVLKGLTVDNRNETFCAKRSFEVNKEKVECFIIESSYYPDCWSTINIKEPKIIEAFSLIL